MTSYASEMPGSPGIVPVDDLYESPNPYHNPFAEQQEQLSSVKEENLRLKTNLTRVQNEYEELRDESNYQRAKVSELTELVKSSSSQPSSFQQSQYTATTGNSNEYTDSAIHKSLIEKSLQNAELTLNYDKIRIELHQAKAKLVELELQKKANGKLLLEMGDVIRTLNLVDIEYKAYTPNGETVSAQQQSIRNIKLKVEAMLNNRNALIKKCRELHESSKFQERKIMILEAQFHEVNSVNISEGLSVAASTLSDDMSQQSSIVSKQPSNSATDAAASEIVRQSLELAKYKKHEQDNANEISNLKCSQKTQKETISRLESEKERLSAKQNSLKISLRSTKALLEDAVLKRDEFKDNLLDIISHYKELEGDHVSSNDKISKLEGLVTMLQSKVRETTEKKLELEKEKSQRSAHTQDSEEDNNHECKMKDLLVAYAKAQREIKGLQEASMKQELEATQYRDTISMFKKIEQERNDFQGKLDRALEENRLTKLQLQKEQDECKQARRQLKTLLQHRDDETASLDSGNTDQRSNASSRSLSRSRSSRSCTSQDKSSPSRSSHDSQTSRSRSATHRKALVKKAAFKPLTVEELMEKDFS